MAHTHKHTLLMISKGDTLHCFASVSDHRQVIQLYQLHLESEEVCNYLMFLFKKILILAKLDWKYIMYMIRKEEVRSWTPCCGEGNIIIFISISEAWAVPLLHIFCWPNSTGPQDYLPLFILGTFTLHTMQHESFPCFAAIRLPFRLFSLQIIW